MSDKDNENLLRNDKKYVSYVISIISLICSIFILFVSFKKIKMTITNILIMQIIMAEIVDGIDIILALVLDIFCDYTFEDYPFRMGLCLTQIYLGVFACLWNLFSSLFISIRLFDRLQNRNKIFKHKFIYDYATTLSYGIPSLITFILWSSQVLYQSNTLENNTYKRMYETKNNINYFRYIYCWVTRGNNIALFVICFLLIITNFFFSIIKSALFIRKISKDIEETEEGGKNVQNKLSKIKKMMCSLIIYPIISVVVWFIYFILQLLANYMNIQNSNEGIAYSMKHGAGAWVLTSIICIRQFIFTLVFFLTQGNLKKHSWNYLTCKYCKNERSEYKSISEVSNDEPKQLLNQNEEEKDEKDE